MKTVNITTSFQSLRSLTTAFTLTAMLFAAGACAQDPTTPATPNASSSAPSNDLVSKWVGAYDPLSRACDKDMLIVHKSKFSWGDCKDVKSRLISTSETGLAIEIDSSAKCGWSGWIVALSTPSPESRAVSVNAYRSLKDYQAKQSKAFCAYSKNF